MGLSEGDKDKLIDESDNFKNNPEGRQEYEDFDPSTLAERAVRHPNCHD
jgi:hypothetical protein